MSISEGSISHLLTPTQLAEESKAEWFSEVCLLNNFRRSLFWLTAHAQDDVIYCDLMMDAVCYFYCMYEGVGTIISHFYRGSYTFWMLVNLKGQRKESVGISLKVSISWQKMKFTKKHSNSYY